MNRQALILVDIQQAMLNENNPVYLGKNLIENARDLINKARLADMDVVYIQHEAGMSKPLEKGTEGWKIHPVIKPEPGDLIIHKKTPDSFYQTELNNELKSRGITEVVITGIQTEICVDTTCRRAFSLGYKVTLVSDTHSTWSSKHLTAEKIINHHNDVLRWFAAVKPSNEITFK